MGVCNVPITARMRIIEGLEAQLGTSIDPERTALNTLGLNHLSWHRGFTLDGEELWPQVMHAFIEQIRAEQDPEWDVADIEALDMIPNYYLQYFCYTARKLAEQDEWPPSRAEEVMALESDLLAFYADPANSVPPELLLERGGAYYSTLAAQLLNAHYSDLGERHVVNVPQRGAVPGCVGAE